VPTEELRTVGKVPALETLSGVDWRIVECIDLFDDQISWAVVNRSPTSDREIGLDAEPVKEVPTHGPDPKVEPRGG